MKKHTKVNCEVENCKHNDSKKCDLDELDISCTCDDDECLDKEETICNNFEKNEDNDDDDLEMELLDDDYDVIDEVDEEIIIDETKKLEN